MLIQIILSKVLNENDEAIKKIFLPVMGRIDVVVKKNIFDGFVGFVQYI